MVMLNDIPHIDEISNHGLFTGTAEKKTATFRQLMGDKLMYQNMLTLYKLYGLIEE